MGKPLPGGLTKDQQRAFRRRYGILDEDQLPSSGGGGSGTVTQVDTELPITGGPITTTGTIGILDFGGSGGSHARGAVPDPGGVAGTTRFLREDGDWAAPPTGITSPLTTKGDLWGYGSADARFPVGSDGQILQADSAETLGLKWVSLTGTSQSQEFTSGSGNFNVPTGVSLVYVTGVGAGGGGGGVLSSATTGCGGGGSGEHGVSMPLKVTPGGTVAYSVGAKGIGVSGAAGTAGGDTTFGVFTFLGGLGATGGNSRVSGAGGGQRGGAATGINNGVTGTHEAIQFFGGSSGGAGGTGAAGNGLAGGPSVFAGGAAGAAGGSQAGGGGGGASPYGPGGAGGPGGSNGVSATATDYGAGGGGSGGKTTPLVGGDGAGGYLLIEWVGP